MNAIINKQQKRKYLFLFSEKLLKIFVLFLNPLPFPKGVPHELHTNLPDNARSALILEPPHTKHIVRIIICTSI